MIEEFCQALSRLKSLKQGQLWNDADALLDAEFQRFLSGGAQAALQMSETELLAKIIQNGPAQAVHTKTLLVATLLKEAGDLAPDQNRPEQSVPYYLKGLDLLLGVLAGGESSDFPVFVPRVQVLVDALQDTPLPLDTMARLMQHYERVGSFGKAEDMLFSMLEAEPGQPGLVEFGVSFYRRLKSQSDDNLSAGNLPRPELEAGLAELQRRKA